MTKTTELQIGLVADILNLIESYGLTGEQNMQVLAQVVTRVICVDAPDRSTADDWHILFSGSIHIAMKRAAADGEASWAHKRFH